MRSLFIFTVFAFYLCKGENIPGVVQLNVGTFDKIIKRFDAALVKFDETYPYGDAQDQFKEVVKSSLAHENLIIAEVHVADYGEKENHELADRYGLKKEDFPAYKLFVRGTEEPLTYTGDVKSADAIKRFVMKEAGVWMGLPGCLEEFDVLIKPFLQAADDDAERRELRQQAQAAGDGLKDSKQQEQADIYLKYFDKIQEKGNDFIDGELNRVEKLIDGKVSDKKKSQLRDRASILTSFQLYYKEMQDSKGKQEL